MGGPYSVKEKDWMGEKTIHYDKDGRKIGESRVEKGLLGEKIVHTDRDGKKVGETRQETENIFFKHEVHRDINGKKIGSSERKDNLSGPVNNHFNASGKKIGYSYEKESYFGNKTIHEGDRAFYEKSNSESQCPSNVDSYNGGGGGGDAYGSTNGNGINRSAHVAIFICIVLFVIILILATQKDLFQKKVKPAPSPSKPVAVAKTPPVSINVPDTTKPKVSKLESVLLKDSDVCKYFDPEIERSICSWIGEKMRMPARWISSNELKKDEYGGYINLSDYDTLGEEIWIVGYGEYGRGYIFYSPNLGIAWELQWREEVSENYEYGCSPICVHFVNNMEGWVGTKDGLCVTYDGGRSWALDRRPYPVNKRIIKGLKYRYQLFGDNRILVSIRFDYDYESRDGGKTWRKASDEINK